MPGSLSRAIEEISGSIGRVQTSSTRRCPKDVSLPMTNGRALPSDVGCIFFGNRPLTKVHIWGQWVLEQVSRTTNKYQFGKVIVGKNQKDTIEIPGCSLETLERD
jgi:hypothetical protein